MVHWRCASLWFCALQVVSLAAWSGPVEDAAITGRIETTFLLNGHLSPFNINTTTEEGVVTLTGSVDNQVQKDLAAELARSVAGVVDVKNEITVVEDAPVKESKRTWQQKIEDATVTASVRTRILYNREFNAFNIKVKTENGHTTLSGVVKTQEQIDRIGVIASETKGVQGVTNNLTTFEREKLDPVQNTGRQLSDEWIEKRVETGLLLNRHVSIRDLAVEVEDGTTILGGTVDSDTQRELAQQIAQNIQGVLKVENNIKVKSVELESLEPISVSE